MPSEKILAAKQERVEELAKSFEGAATFVFASTRGLTVAQDTKMRADLRAAGVKFEIIKNTTLVRVFEKLGYEGLEDTFKGPTAVAFSENIVAPAKILAKYAEEYEPMELKGGIIDGKVASLDEIVALSKVPDPETLYTQLAYTMLFPFTKLAMLVKAVAEKKEEEGGAPAQAEAAAEPVAEAVAAEAETPAETPAE